MASWSLRRIRHRFRWRASHPLWRRRLARSAGVWALIAMAASAFYLGFIGPILSSAGTGPQGTFHQTVVSQFEV